MEIKVYYVIYECSRGLFLACLLGLHYTSITNHFCAVNSTMSNKEISIILRRGFTQYVSPRVSIMILIINHRLLDCWSQLQGVPNEQLVNS